MQIVRKAVVDAAPKAATEVASQLNKFGIGAPQQEEMERGDALDILTSHDGLIINSVEEDTCCGGCCTCCPPLEFTIEPKKSTGIVQSVVGSIVSKEEEENKTIMYSTEESSLFCRCCLCNKREFTQTITLGNEPGGEQFMQLQTPANCGAYANTCCCTPKMKIFDSKGEQIGRVNIPCYSCCGDPNVVVMDAEGEKEFNMELGTSCCGLCPDFSQGCCTYVFHIYPKEKKGKIGKVVSRNCCSTFELDFPKNSSSQQRARLLGATFLINMSFFEDGVDYLSVCIGCLCEGE